MTTDKYLTVTALTRYLHKKFTVDPYLQRVFLTGEISNFRLRPRHQYFSIKDDNAKISAVMFQSNFKRVKFIPEEGMKVLLVGRIDLYEPNGTYQINIESMQPDGVGALYEAYEQLKKKLAAEGLFSVEKKRIPRFPQKIAVITSPSGAVIRDIMTTVKRRYPIAQLVLFPAVVQGEQAADSLVGRLKEVTQHEDFDTVIIGRGGGSIEDLWPFNEEKVARAIAAVKIPVISSVGHETDTTIADLVADLRAPTPTAAAELATPLLSDEILKLKQQRLRLVQAMKTVLDRNERQAARQIDSYIFKTPARLYEGYLQKLDFLNSKLEAAFGQELSRVQREQLELNSRLKMVDPKPRLKRSGSILATNKQQLQRNMQLYLVAKKNELAQQVSNLDVLSPLSVMGRGYSYVSHAGKITKSVKNLDVDDKVVLHMADGIADARIIDTKEEQGNE
ncbi:exodeoxyribonuclease VII large subunit [Ligilactobacillus acidipiscis]|uniref:Exodeoxyribonuclease 7 large subunit n=1 Tax=Ligilactobacillus acidipiscis TaxID=89059 RepID=A0A0R2KG08_9LACO|nr:exodeoxyribonuclease VII large subunit [Ligilactobacillus acidipiscis]KRN88219.1 exodeoxyribonuclease VII large subunit [Ligilactobacillus acidipiscis]SFV40723.1 Exodeoxyribonuclease VII large subunit [Ligilactobacillus acidipiscis]